MDGLSDIIVIFGSSKLQLFLWAECGNEYYRFSLHLSFLIYYKVGLNFLNYPDNEVYLPPVYHHIHIYLKQAIPGKQEAAME